MKKQETKNPQTKNKTNDKKKKKKGGRGGEKELVGVRKLKN